MSARPAPAGHARAGSRGLSRLLAALFATSSLWAGCTRVVTPKGTAGWVVGEIAMSYAPLPGAGDASSARDGDVAASEATCGPIDALRLEICDLGGFGCVDSAAFPCRDGRFDTSMLPSGAMLTLRPGTWKAWWRLFDRRGKQIDRIDACDVRAPPASDLPLCDCVYAEAVADRCASSITVSEGPASTGLDVVYLGPLLGLPPDASPRDVFVAAFDPLGHEVGVDAEWTLPPGATCASAGVDEVRLVVYVEDQDVPVDLGGEPVVFDDPRGVLRWRCDRTVDCGPGCTQHGVSTKRVLPREARWRYRWEAWRDGGTAPVATQDLGLIDSDALDTLRPPPFAIEP
ncbi:MAG: hypothetical protein KC543_10620 [Myxococcales bacterium]|nr:hypothetical protein [Myxococcales bacterium]